MYITLLQKCITAMKNVCLSRNHVKFSLLKIRTEKYVCKQVLCPMPVNSKLHDEMHVHKYCPRKSSPHCANYNYYKLLSECIEMSNLKTDIPTTVMKMHTYILWLENCYQETM